jgi:hypothetical protein
MFVHSLRLPVRFYDDYVTVLLSLAFSFSMPVPCAVRVTMQPLIVKARTG